MPDPKIPAANPFKPAHTAVQASRAVVAEGDAARQKFSDAVVAALGKNFTAALALPKNRPTYNADQKSFTFSMTLPLADLPELTAIAKEAIQKRYYGWSDPEVGSAMFAGAAMAANARLKEAGYSNVRVTPDAPAVDARGNVSGSIQVTVDFPAQPPANAGSGAGVFAGVEVAAASGNVGLEASAQADKQFIEQIVSAIGADFSARLENPRDRPRYDPTARTFTVTLPFAFGDHAELKTAVDTARRQKLMGWDSDDHVSKLAAQALAQTKQLLTEAGYKDVLVNPEQPQLTVEFGGGYGYPGRNNSQRVLAGSSEISVTYGGP